MSDIKILIGADIKELEQKLAVAKAKFADLGGVAQKAGIGINAFGGAALLAGTALIELGKKLFEVSAAQKRFNEVLDEAKSSYVKAVLEVDKMRDAFQKAKDGIITKDSALKLYNSTIGKTIGQTGDLDVAEQNFIDNAANYVKYTLLKAAANIALGKAADAAFQAEAERIKGVKNVTAAQKAGTFRINISALSSLDLKNAFFSKKDEQIVSDKIQKYKTLEQVFKDVYDSFTKSLKEYNFTEIEGLDLLGKKEKKLRTVSDVLADLKSQTDLLNKTEDLLGTDETKAKISALKKAFDELIKDFKLKASNPIIIDIVARVRKLEYEDLLKDTNLGDTFFANRTIGIDKPVIVKFKKIQFDTKAAGIDESLIKFQDEVTAAISQTIGNIGGVILSSAADSIADALAGNKGALPRLFDNIIKGIGQQLKELGQYLVKIGIAKLAIDKAIEALKISPAVTIAVGFATQVLGSLLIAQAQKKAGGLGQGFASGTTGVNQGGIYDVGERGPERIFLPAGAKVQPNNELNAFSGGNQVFIPAVTLSGPDLVIAFNRASQMMNRNN